MKTLVSYAAAMLLRTYDPYVCLPPSAHVPHAFIALSGTRTARDLVLDDLDIRPASWPERGHGGKVHGGFARRTGTLLHRMDAFVQTHDDFVVAGHSLGGACAILAASKLVHEGKHVHRVLAFGTPQLATRRFRDFYRGQGLATRTRLFATPKDPVVHSIPYVYGPVAAPEIVACNASWDPWMQHDMRAYVDALAHV